MDFSVKSGSPQKQRIACIVVGIFEGRKYPSITEELDKASQQFISHIVRRGDMEGKLGQTLLLHDVPGTLCDRVLVIGCGKERELGESQYRKIITKTINQLNEHGINEAACFLTELNVKSHDTYWKVRQAVEITEDTNYVFDALKSKKDAHRRSLKRLTFNVPTRRDLTLGEEAVMHGKAIASGIKCTKDLANLPANICTPTYLAEQAQKLATNSKLVSVNVLDKADIEQLGMGAFLSVAKGSNEPLKMIVLEYNHAPQKQKPVVLVGKGVTFDSGGISLKPGEAMDEMKFDMCGAASVLGVFHALTKLALPINVVGIIAATENMPSGHASRPGDIVKTMSGQTVEILNTDAEGRLILCDALTYAEKFNPDTVIDIATLTGACIIALGAHASGLLSNHNPLAHDLLDAGQHACDRAWRLPLWEEYQEQLDSNFADMANIGGRPAGTITAACFLARFTKKYQWAHLDIAGTAWRSGKAKGATGRPVPLLMQYLLNIAKK